MDTVWIFYVKIIWHAQKVHEEQIWTADLELENIWCLKKHMTLLCSVLSFDNEKNIKFESVVDAFNTLPDRGAAIGLI